MFKELLEALKQRPAFVRLMRIVEVLIIDALIAIVNMVLIAIVGGLAHVLHLDTHQLFQGLTVADIFKAAHALNLIITLGFGLFHLAKELMGHK